MKALETVPRTISAAYDDVLTRIEQNGDIELVLKILSWLYYAREPLSMGALCEALVVEEGDTDLQRTYMLKPHDIVECCKSLVTHETSSGLVRFTHYTVQEFMGTIESRLLSHADLASTCLNYLAFDVFNVPCPDDNSYESRVKQYVFGPYAGNYWGFYAVGEPENSSAIQKALVRALGVQGKRDTAMQFLESKWISEISIFKATQGQTFLHMIARAGLSTICRKILSSIPDTNTYFTLGY